MGTRGVFPAQKQIMRFACVYVAVYVRRPKSVDARTTDARKDLQVYCAANKCNSITEKRERVTLNNK